MLLTLLQTATFTQIPTQHVPYVMQGTTLLQATQSVLPMSAQPWLSALSATVLRLVFAAVLDLSSTPTDLHVLKSAATIHNAIFA